MFNTKDSGKRVVFDTGAQRDDARNKPSFSKRTLQEYEDFGNENKKLFLESNKSDKPYAHFNIDSYPAPHTGKDESVDFFLGEHSMLYYTKDGEVEIRKSLVSKLLLNRLEALLQRGAEKYTPDNWQKGLPLDVCFDSAMRHIVQWRFSDTSEDHLTAAICNLMFIMVLENKINIGELPRELIKDCGVLR